MAVSGSVQRAVGGGQGERKERGFIWSSVLCAERVGGGGGVDGMFSASNVFISSSNLVLLRIRTSIYSTSFSKLIHQLLRLRGRCKSKCMEFIGYSSSKSTCSLHSLELWWTRDRISLRIIYDS